MIVRCWAGTQSRDCINDVAISRVVWETFGFVLVQLRNGDNKEAEQLPNAYIYIVSDESADC